MQNGWSPGRCRLLAHVPGVFLSSLFAIVRRGPHINLCASVRHGHKACFSSDKSTHPPVPLAFTSRPLHLNSLSSPPPTSNILRQKPIQRGAPLKCAVRDSLSLSLSLHYNSLFTLWSLSFSEKPHSPAEAKLWWRIGSHPNSKQPKVFSNRHSSSLLLSFLENASCQFWFRVLAFFFVKCIIELISKFFWSKTTTSICLLLLSFSILRDQI